ncbi:Chitin binding protein [Leifsonia rubra CMS 76R]|nr:Chitin binding protein [Leifsonia rubra CMS 76R]
MTTMKTRAALVTLVALLGGALVTAPATAATADVFTVDGIEYTADLDDVPAGAIVTGYDAGAGGTDPVIPASVTNPGTTTYEVVGIGDSAFNSKSLTSVTIGSNVTAIGNSAFYTNDLTSVTIPNNVTTVGDYAFYANSALATVMLGSGVTSIGDSAFYLNALMSVTLPDSVITIDRWAFGYNDLTSVTIPNNATTIGDNAFKGNTVLASVTIGSSVTTIGDSAFESNALTSVAMPDSVITIGDWAFANNALTSVTIGNSVTDIGANAFDGNDFTSVTIPNSVTTIGYSAFVNNALTSVTIGNSVTDIGDSAFDGNDLTSVTIPNSVTTIGPLAFNDNQLASVVIGNSVTTIENSAFRDNLLTSVTIPRSVTSIGQEAFNDNALTTVTFKGDAPTLAGAFALDDTDPLVRFYTGDAGFTSPTWNGGGGTEYTTSQVVTDFPDGVTRLYGASRYETAVRVSQQSAPGVPAVFVAAGTNFPDALSAAAAAAYVGGPLLLTTPGAIPANVVAEIQRLNPTKIYIAGGTGAVSASVETVLEGIAPVIRFGGGDRYATGLELVGGIFPSSASVVLATGRNFPDALAATGVAGKLSSPVVLVDGLQSTISSATLAEFSRMGVTDVIIAGGTGVISAGIRTQLNGLGYTVSRYGGADRYATAALINNAYFPAGSADTLVLANGTNFPDALAGAAMAGLIGAPLYTTSPTCAPTPIHNSIITLGPSKTVVLGGPAVLSNNAANNGACS